MGLFLAIYLFIYGGMNACFFFQARRAFHPGRTWTVALGLSLVLMLLGPFITRLMVRSEHLQVASFCSFIGFTWMGLVFSFLVASFVLHLIMIPVTAFGWWQGTVIQLGQWAKPLFLLPCLYMIFVFAVGYYQADLLRLEEHTLMLHRTVNGFQPMSIVQLSDLHLGLTAKHNRIRRVVEMTRAARPDLLVVTGDLLDGPIPQEEEIAEWLRTVEAPLGKFFVLGNHEMYEGIQHAERFASLAGLKLLRDETVQINETLELSGVDDPALVEQNGGKALRDLALLPVLSESRVRVFLKHRPVIETDALGRFDIQLSGHTHSGKIFPFGYFTNLFATRPCGLHTIGQAWFYHHRGSGTWGTPLRFFTSSEVTLLHLVPFASDTGNIVAD